jgi:hypothetical protein
LVGSGKQEQGLSQQWKGVRRILLLLLLSLLLYLLLLLLLLLLFHSCCCFTVAAVSQLLLFHSCCCFTVAAFSQLLLLFAVVGWPPAVVGNTLGDSPLQQIKPLPDPHMLQQAPYYTP